MKEITINKNDAGQRIDKFLTKKFTSMPKSLLYKYVRTKRIKVNGKRVKENYMLNAGDILSFYIPDEFFAENQSKAFLVSRSDIKVCYEDENILIVDKEKGLICHGIPEGTEDTLLPNKGLSLQRGNTTRKRKHLFLPLQPDRPEYPGAGDSGENAEALRIMNEIIKNREIEKGYLAVSHGILKNRKGELVSYLEKNKEENKVYVKKSPAEGALTAKLEYEVIAENKQKNLSLLKINLKTGRTHQIRAQFAAEGHPILGDGKYAVNKDDRKMGFSSQALCSYSVGFRFVSDKGILNYLNGVTVKTEKPDFVGLFY